MSKMTMIIASYCAALLLMSAPAAAYTPDYNVTLSPYIGTGSQSNGASVRHSSGVRVTAGRRFVFSKRNFTVGPHFEIGNGIFSAKRATHSNQTAISNYDNRFFLAGLHLGKLYGDITNLPNEVFFRAAAGYAESKLSEDESGENIFIQKDYHKIRGKYFSTEIGTAIQLQRNFHLNASLVGQLYQADQSDAKGTVEGDTADSTGAYSLSEEEKAEYATGLDDEMVQRTLAASIGLSLGF
jgi:outer membrane autotransporter protein